MTTKTKGRLKAGGTEHDSSITKDTHIDNLRLAQPDYSTWNSQTRAYNNVYRALPKKARESLTDKGIITLGDLEGRCLEELDDLKGMNQEHRRGLEVIAKKVKVSFIELYVPSYISIQLDTKERTILQQKLPKGTKQNVVHKMIGELIRGLLQSNDPTDMLKAQSKAKLRKRELELQAEMLTLRDELRELDAV